MKHLRKHLSPGLSSEFGAFLDDGRLGRPGNGWYARAQNQSGQQRTLTVEAYCLRP